MIDEKDKKFLRDHTIKNPEICFGKTTIKGTRITLKLISELHDSDYNAEMIVHEYPHLKIDVIRSLLKIKEKYGYLPKDKSKIKTIYCKQCKKEGKHQVKAIWDSFWVYDKNGDPVMHVNVYACPKHNDQVKDIFQLSEKTLEQFLAEEPDLYSDNDLIKRNLTKQGIFCSKCGREIKKGESYTRDIPTKRIYCVNCDEPIFKGDLLFFPGE